MSLNIYVRLIPQVLNNLHCRHAIITNFRVCKNLHPASYWCRFQSSHATTQKNPNEIVVYHGTLTTQLRAVKIFSLMTSMSGIIAQPFVYDQLVSLNSIPLMVAAWSFFGFFTIGTPLLLHLLARKYVTVLKYKPDTDTYVATTLNIINIPKQLEFKPEDVKVPEVLGMFTTFTAKDKALFVDPRFFENPKHYGRIMGYDKPLDLKLFKTTESDNKK